MTSNDLPLCASRIFLYPGEPEGAGIIGYETGMYRSEFENINFVDSTQFIHSLENDITLRDRSLLQVADGEQFEIPEYQRNYSWTTEQHEEMWETLKHILQLKSQANDKPSDTFFGSIYVAKSPKRDRYEIIDGQQRLATIAIILKNLGEQLSVCADSVDGELASYAEHVRESYIEELLYRQKGPAEVPFLSLNDHDNDWFHLLFKDDTDKAKAIYNMSTYDGRKKNAVRLDKLLNELDISEDDYPEDIDAPDLDEFRYYGDAHQKLVEADEYYREKITSLINRDKFDFPEAKARILVNLTQYVLRSLRVSECLFETDDQELRIQVFQSLNDRGIELSKMDKVRARIVGRFQGAEDSDKQIGRWETVMREFGTDASSVEDFLAHYLAATEKEFRTVTEARNNMLEAFRLRESSSKEVRSRLASKGEARDFLEELEAYAQRYREITNADLTEHPAHLDEDHRKRAEAILRRLEALGTKSWRPFIMYIYQEVVETPDKGEFFHKILQAVESIMFRFVISPHQATVIDDTFPKTTQRFIELEQSGEQFDVEKISEILIENVDDDAREMFGEDFVTQLISEKDWQNNRIKQILMKVVDEDQQRRNKTGITNTSLSQDTGKVHVEHILPSSFILHGKNKPYAWLENFFDSNSDNRLKETINLLKDQEIENIDDPADRYGDLDPIINRIEESFVNDLGNVILLAESVNKQIQNSLFSKKLRAYHKNHSKDMDHIANEFFTTGGEIDKQLLDDLLRADMPDDETIDGSAPVIQTFNQWWTWERSVQRKATLSKAFLKTLEMPSNEDEFGDVYGDVHTMIKNDYDTRITLANS